MNIIIDLDGVICTEEKTFERYLAKPLEGVRFAMYNLHCAGHKIVIYTARSWAEERITREWLKNNNVVYDVLLMGKPIGDVWIDDRAIRFESWDKTQALLNKDIKDDYNLYQLRKITKQTVEEVSRRHDIKGPILEIGPNNPDSNIFKRMPDTFFNSKELFSDVDVGIVILDCDASVKPDIIGSINNLSGLFAPGELGTIICNSVLEHVFNIDNICEEFYTVLMDDGKVFMVSPWNIRLHGPRPDCRRISDDGFIAMFDKKFNLKINKYGDDPLNPVAFIIEMTKKV
jgi:hypothetical protein